VGAWPRRPESGCPDSTVYVAESRGSVDFFFLEFDVRRKFTRAQILLAQAMNFYMNLKCKLT